MPPFRQLWFVVEILLMIHACQGFMSHRLTPASTSNTQLSMASASSNTPIRFLGRGDRAVVRPGVVLVAPQHEYDHFLMRSAIFIHAMGLDDYDEYVIRGVIIDHPTPFTMGEMGTSVSGALAHNLLFRGGNAGSDNALMLHSSEMLGSDEIGTSGIYQGGLQQAMDACDSGKADPEEFKFFFNYCQFREAELENMLAEADSDGDAWASVEVDPKLVLNSDWDRGDAWSRLRNAIAQAQM